MNLIQEDFLYCKVNIVEHNFIRYQTVTRKKVYKTGCI